MYILSLSRKSENVNTWKEIFVGAFLLRQKGEKILDYLTTKELSELKGCSMQILQKQIKNGKIFAEQQPHPQNKQLCYMIPVSALSEDL